MLIASFALGLAACSPTLLQGHLYEHLGEREGIAALVDSFIATVRRDPRIQDAFRRVNIPRLKLLMADQICAELGGPCTYTGRDMQSAHQRLHVSQAQFDAFLEDWRMSLAHRGLTAAEEARLGSFFAGMQHQIVSPPG
jgi:hemoglobin